MSHSTKELAETIVRRLMSDGLLLVDDYGQNRAMELILLILEEREKDKQPGDDPYRRPDGSFDLHEALTNPPVARPLRAMRPQDFIREYVLRRASAATGALSPKEEAKKAEVYLEWELCYRAKLENSR